MIVLDASAAVDLLLSTERAPAIIQALATVSEAHAPELIDPEALAVIRRFTLQGWISAPAGERVVSELGELAFVRHRHARCAPASGSRVTAPAPMTAAIWRWPSSSARSCLPPTRGSPAPPAGSSSLRSGPDLPPRKLPPLPL